MTRWKYTTETILGMLPRDEGDWFLIKTCTIVFWPGMLHSVGFAVVILSFMFLWCFLWIWKVSVKQCKTNWLASPVLCLCRWWRGCPPVSDGRAWRKTHPTIKRHISKDKGSEQVEIICSGGWKVSLMFNYFFSFYVIGLHWPTLLFKAIQIQTKPI